MSDTRQHQLADVSVGILLAPEGSEEVVVDGPLITSRNPDDLDAFCGTLLEEFADRGA